MANVLDIRRRIRSVVNTRQITKAMKTVSAAKLRRAQEGALAARPYSQMLTNVLKSLVSRADIYDPITGEPRHPLLAERPENSILLIVVTGDKGLAGAFNTNILKMVSKFIESKPEQNIDVECIGRKGRDFMRRRYPMAPERAPVDGATGVSPVQPGSEAAPPRAGRVQIVGEYVGVLGKVEHNFAATLSESVIARYTRGEIDGVYILFNEFKSVIAQRLVAERLLPIKEIGEVDVLMAEEASEEERKRRIEAAKSAHVGLRPIDTSAVDEAAAKFGASPVDYIYEQPPEQLFGGILPKYLGIQIFHALLESVAAEHAARMTAMDAATNNASDMIDSLTLVMNRARQAKITKEIIEIVSGAAAQ
ncbi:ATP synthase gamma chain [Candidatus Sulfotelmatobacter sp. SbA7]|nr:ATP synthase gamma chain [Candidatus Sulfotelmatobacter sp. SbA7]